MGFLFGRKKIAEPPKQEETREEKLNKNADVPFTTEIPEKVEGAKRAYYYERIKCEIIGNVTGLTEGAVLYIQRDGFLTNVAHEKVAQIENKKLQNMVNDFFDKQRFCIVRVKYVCIEDNSLFCHMGFYRDTVPVKYDDEDDEDDE